MRNMQFYYCLLFTLLGTAKGSPYYYREDNHHSEHHKEYSYSNSQPSSSAYESSPQKYIETSHFSTHAVPGQYYKFETNPSFSSGFSEYSGGGQAAFHQNEFQSSGTQSSHSHLSPLLTGQNIKVDGIKPGTYVIKQVKIYRKPTTYTGFYGASHIDGRGLETGQQEENLYENQHKQDLNLQTGQYVKQVRTNLYNHELQTHPTITRDESLFGQKQISEEDFSQFGQQQISGQKEDSTYNEHMEDLGQPQRGDLGIGQEQEDLSMHHSQIMKTLEKTPVNDKNKGYKYYEKRVITYGSPDKESKSYKQTYVHQTQKHGTVGIGGKDFEKYQDILIGPTTIKTTNGFENMPTGTRQESKQVIYSQEAVGLEKNVQPIKPPMYYSNPVYIPQPAPLGQQIYSGSLEQGQHEESQYVQHSSNLGQQIIPGSLEIGQQPESITGQQLETGSFELGQNEENLNGKHVHTWERHVNTSTVEVKGSNKVPGQKPIEHHFRTERLEIGKNSDNKPHILVKENVTRTVIVGHSIPTKPILNLPEGQIEEAVSGQNIETGIFEMGQNEENVGQLETGDLSIGQHEENVGQLETVDLGIGQHEENVGQLETGDLGMGQHEENIGQLERGDLGMGQHEEILEVGKNSENLGQKEETSYDFELSKSTFPIKLKVTPTEAPKYNEHTSYVKTYNQHESHYKELKHSSNSNLKDLPVNQKYDSITTPRSNEQDTMNTNKNTDYLKLQQKADELALQFGFEDISKQKSSQQDSYEDRFVKENVGKTSTSEVQATGLQEHSIANHHTLEKGSLTPNKKITTWETHKEEYGLNYPVTSQASYFKKQANHHSEGYINQPMSQNYGYQGQSQHSSHYGGYRQGYSVNSGEKTYFSDQPIQRTHTSGSQFSFSSSSGSSQDKQKVIDDFLKELDKDIAITNHRQQQASYAGMTHARPVNSDVNYYSQRTVSSHSNSSYSSSGTVQGGTAGKTWYQRIGDSIGSGYNQAKEKAKDFAKTVKQSVGYSS